MRTAVGIIILLGALALAPGASIATHDGEESTCTIGDAPGEVIGIGDDPTTAAEDNVTYVNVRDDPALDVRLYIETNGIDGLQTGGANPTQSAVQIGYTDSGWQKLCTHEPDTLIL